MLVSTGIRHMPLFLILLFRVLQISCSMIEKEDAPPEFKYGTDCSFAVHKEDVRPDCAIGNQRQLYQEYMDGCREYYSPEDCDSEETVRLEMNVRQPQSIVNYTATGYHKVKAPESLQKLLSEFWANNKDKMYNEEWTEGNIYTNHWEIPTKMMPVENQEMVGGGGALQNAIWKAAQDGVEEWTQMKMRPSSLYGIRVYEEGAMLNPHVDRIPLVSSCIVNVAQDVDEEWPLEVYGRDGNAVNITMEPFDMVFYESASLIHGRPFPLKGRFYANVFIHFEIVGRVGTDEGLETSVDEEWNITLPPYVIPGSPEAAHWIDQNPGGWSIAGTDEDLVEIHQWAAQGDTASFLDFLQKDPTLVNFTDINGWQPLHEAVTSEQLEMVVFLIERGADVSARANWGVGPSPLHIAKEFYDPDHEICRILVDAGALDFEDESDYDEDEWEYLEEEDEEEEDSMQEAMVDEVSEMEL